MVIVAVTPLGICCGTTFFSSSVSLICRVIIKAIKMYCYMLRMVKWTKQTGKTDYKNDSNVPLTNPMWVICQYESIMGRDHWSGPFWALTQNFMTSSNGKHFPRYWPFVRGMHRPPVNSPHKGQWRGALMFSLICTRINGLVNNGETCDLRSHRAHYDVTVMSIAQVRICNEWCLNVMEQPAKTMTELTDAIKDVQFWYGTIQLQSQVAIWEW